MKRKLPHSSDEDSDSPGPQIPPPSSPPPRKRRCTTLERGFADLSLAAPSFTVREVSPPLSSELIPMDTDMTPAAYVVEEPGYAPEVKMKVSSWYEPERDRIVITDLDSFTESDDDQGEPEEVVINPVLLEHIRSSTQPSSPLAPGTSQALVLFKPLPGFGASEEKREEVVIAEERPAVVNREDDAMDVEP